MQTRSITRSAARPLVLAAALAAALPAVARADVASFDGTTVRVQGDDRNETILLSLAPSGELSVNTDDVGPGCHVGPLGDDVRCPLGPGGVVVSMAGGDDNLTSLYTSEGGLPDGALHADLGAGNDHFTGGGGGGAATSGAATVSGGPGNDELAGGAGADVLDGGEGNDTLTGNAGRDQLLAGPGDDVLDGDRFEVPAADVMDGGPGSDRAEGWNIPDEDTHPPIAVTLNGAADDGRPGEGDNVSGVERVTSNVSGRIALSDAPDVVEMWANLDYGASVISTLGGEDRVTGGNASESIDGGAGADRLEGGFGDDTITAGPGRDTVIGDKSGGQCGLFESCSLPVGNDTIDVRDGEIDSVSCGVGTDSVRADADDTVSEDCEKVDRSTKLPDTPFPHPGPGPRHGPLTPHLTASVTKARLTSALARGLRVSVSVPAAGRLSANAKRAGLTVAAAPSRTLRGAGHTTLVLRFTAAGRRRLRRAAGAKLIVTVRLVPVRGTPLTHAATTTLTRR